MAVEVVYSTSLIENSIINSKTGDDITSPFSFLEFITRTRIDYGPEEYNKFYIVYLQEWNKAKGSSEEEARSNTTKTYVDFLKEITLTYTTQQEKRFLNTLNFNDPVDLDIIIPFYVEKIRDIIIFYKEKRDQGKYIIDRNKIKGTKISIERALFESIYNFVFAIEDTPVYRTGTATLSSLRENLGIDVLEYVDVYGNYFDIPRDDSEFSRVNSNDIDATLFFNDPRTIFRSRVFLREIPIAVNVAISYDSICDPENPLALLQNECEDTTGLAAEQRVRLKQQFLRKYAGVDCYYINTTVSPPVSGRLFTAENPIANIENLQTIDTPIQPSGVNKLLRDVGLFFTPDKTGLFKLDVPSLEYRINFNQLGNDRIYVFPDPLIYGNVSINKQEFYPLVHTYDARKDIRNISSSLIAGDPYVRSSDQTISPYFSKEQLNPTELSPDDELLLNFKDLYNEGFITKYQTDIFGNEYAMFKDKFGYNSSGISTLPEDFILNLLLNGHEFFDLDEGYNFDYSTVSQQGTTIRSGLTSHTVEDEQSPSFLQTTNPYYLFFRNFFPYQELNTFGAFDFSDVGGARVLTVDLRDCSTFTFPNGDPLPDPILADNSAWPSSQQYFYNTLYDAGVATLNPLVRAQTSSPSLTGNFTNDVKFALSGIGTARYDGGYFTDTLNTGTDFSFNNQYTYIDTVLPSSSTIVSSTTGTDTLLRITERRELQGKIFVKEQKLSKSAPLSSKLAPIFSKYSQAVREQIYTSPKDFDVVYDTIAVETSNYLVFDRINYNEEYRKSTTINTVITRENDPLNKFSNRFFNEKDKTITYCVLDSLKPVDPSPSYIYGADGRNIIWQVDVENATQVPVLSTGFIGGQINAMAFDTSRRHLFFNRTPGTGNLYFWDLSSSSHTLLGNLNSAPWNLGITVNAADGFFYDNAYWFFFPWADNYTGPYFGTELVKVAFSYTTGSPVITSVNVLPTNAPLRVRGGDSVIDPNTGLIYVSPGYSTFFSLCVTNLQNSYQPISRLPVSQLSFNRDYSKLYGHRNTTGEWFELSPTTGEQTRIRFKSDVTPSQLNDVGFKDICGSDSVVLLAASAISITEGVIPTKTLTIYPTIYQYNVGEHTNIKLYPLTTDIQGIKDIFSLDSVITDDFNPTFTRISKPVITYNSLNDIFKLTYTCYDNNNFAYIVDREFDITVNGVVFPESKIYRPSKTTLTTDFSNNNFTITSVLSGEIDKTNPGTLIV